MKNSPKVSVIIPNYNHANYLHKRIESVLNQTYQNFELILLDDASTDKSLEVMQQYANHPRVTHFMVNTHDSGSPFKQWQKGIELAKGEYIWIAESDDYSDHVFLENLVEKLELNKKIGIAFCESVWVDSQNKLIRMLDEPFQEHTFSGKEFIKTHLSSGNAIYNASMAVFRKEAIKYVNKCQLQKFKYCGDWFFWFSIALYFDVYRTTEPLNFYRRHTESVSVKSDRNGLYFFEGKKILQKIYSQLSWKEKYRVSRSWASRWVRGRFSFFKNIEVFLTLLRFPLIIILFFKQLSWQKMKKIMVFQ